VAGQVQGKNSQELKKKKRKKKRYTVMNPIWRQMKKRTPSSGQNGQLVHWWLLVDSAHLPVVSDATGSMLGTKHMICSG